jgi:uncharacterized membrane protein
MAFANLIFLPMSVTRRFALLLTIGLTIAWVVMTIVVYAELPATLATHFGPDGRANQFADKSISSWFMLTIIGVATTVLTLSLAQLTHAKPELYNIPGKIELLSLPRERQSPFLEEMALWMTLMSLSMVILFAAIQYDMWRVAVSSQRGLSAVSVTAMVVSLGGLTLGTPIWLVGFRRRVVAESARLVARGRAS